MQRLGAAPRERDRSHRGPALGRLRPLHLHRRLKWPAAPAGRGGARGLAGEGAWPPGLRVRRARWQLVIVRRVDGEGLSDGLRGRLGVAVAGELLEVGWLAAVGGLLLGVVPIVGGISSLHGQVELAHREDEDARSRWDAQGRTWGDRRWTRTEGNGGVRTDICARPGWRLRSVQRGRWSGRTRGSRTIQSRSDTARQAPDKATAHRHPSPPGAQPSDPRAAERDRAGEHRGRNIGRPGRRVAQRVGESYVTSAADLRPARTTPLGHVSVPKEATGAEQRWTTHRTRLDRQSSIRPASSYTLLRHGRPLLHLAQVPRCSRILLQCVYTLFPLIFHCLTSPCRHALLGTGPYPLNVHIYLTSPAHTRCF